MIITRSEKEMKDIMEKENIELDQEIKNLKENRKQNIKKLKLEYKNKLKELGTGIQDAKNKIVTNKKYLEIINKKLAREDNGKETTVQINQVQDNPKKQKNN